MTVDSSRTVVLITGANRGIGFETVKTLLKAEPTSSFGSGAPYHVYLGSRSLEKGEEAAGLLKAMHSNSVSVLQLDMTSPESIASAVSKIKAETGRVDILVNNAGISSSAPDSISRLRENLEANLVSPWAVSEAFQPLMLVQPAQGKEDKRIINVSSDMGSVTWRYDPDNKYYNFPSAEYRTSKAGVNMMTACQSFALKDKGVKAFVFNPGYTATGLSGSPEQRRQRGAWEADIPAAELARVVAGTRDGDKGKMIEVGGIVPW